MSTLTGNIFITGGSGTLGKAILTIAERERWDARFTIYSRSELTQAKLRARFPSAHYVLGDIGDADRLAAAVAGHDVIVHAAAVKRIPEAEQQPANCYQTNVIGSMNVVLAALLHNVRLCVGISTDKACAPITAYGASKLAMEKLFQAQAIDTTRFVLMRYGNVIASNGSVIPVWRQQAARGLPLSLTDPMMTRFWMPPSAAVDLINQASDLPSGSILVPKMSALSIRDMAECIAPGAPIQVIGLRSIEKRHEDLVHAEEPAIPYGERFIRITPVGGGGDPGHAYTSEHAPRLTSDQFLAMLAEAEELER